MGLLETYALDCPRNPMDSIIGMILSAKKSLELAIVSLKVCARLARMVRSSSLAIGARMLMPSRTLSSQCPRKQQAVAQRDFAIVLCRLFYARLGNASEAYRQAGYQGKNADVLSAQLLVNPSILQANQGDSRGAG